MKQIWVAALLLLLIPAALFAIDIAANDGARLDIVSRTSFGVDLDNPYRFGLKNELTQMDLVFGLASYQKISNRLFADDAVGFINITLFNLDLIKIAQGTGYNPPGNIQNNRFQTGEFLAGIAKGPWLFQLNAGGNEPFASPWNKSMDFINDRLRFSWAYLDSMVDIRRINYISGVPAITKRGEENMRGDGQTGEHPTMKQFGFDNAGNIADRFAPGPDYTGNMIAVMYNSDNFGINTKLATQYAFDSSAITEKNANGLGAGIDTTITPSALDGLKILASVMGTVNYDYDLENDEKMPNPIAGGTRIGYAIPLGEDGDISVEPWVGLDLGTFINPDNSMQKMGYEASVGLTMRWPGSGGWFKDYIINSDGRVFPGMSVGYKIYEDRENNAEMEHSIKLTMFEPKGDEGLFYKIGSEIVVDILDLTDVNKGEGASTDNPPGGFSILATAYVDYELTELVGKVPGLLVPWTILYFDNYHKPFTDDERINDFKVDFGINWENFIANTTFGIVWNSGSLLQKDMQVNNAQLGYLRLMAEIRL